MPASIVSAVRMALTAATGGHPDIGENRKATMRETIHERGNVMQDQIPGVGDPPEIPPPTPGTPTEPPQESPPGNPRPEIPPVIDDPANPDSPRELPPNTPEDASLRGPGAPRKPPGPM